MTEKSARESDGIYLATLGLPIAAGFIGQQLLEPGAPAWGWYEVAGFITAAVATFATWLYRSFRK